MKTKQLGFTLVEILLAMGIFIVGVLAIIAVFPRATGDMLKSENDNIAAAFADSLMGALQGGARQYKGNKLASSLTEQDVVWFTFELEPSGNLNNEQDFFVLPQAANDIVWYPIPDRSFPLSYSTVSANNYFRVNGYVRQMGLAALGSSQLAFDIANTEEDNPERLKEFYFCFNVQLEPGFNNLYHFILFIYHNGVVPGGTNTPITAHELLKHDTFIDNSSPQNTGDAVSPANNFIQRFDFLLKI